MRGGRLSPLCLPLPPLTASTASGSRSRILEGQNTKLPEYQNEVWPAWARLPDYKTTRPPLSLLNVSKGFHCLLKSALVPPKTAPHTLSQNGASFLDSGFLCSACAVPVGSLSEVPEAREVLSARDRRSLLRSHSPWSSVTVAPDGRHIVRSYGL